MTNVFVSRPSQVGPQYQDGLDGFLRVLSLAGLEGRTLGKTDYPRRAPLDEVLKVLKTCSGAVILGYPQIRVVTGTIRNAPIVQPMELPTEWNHIEAALAVAMRIPVLMIHHNTVSRGVFDRGATSQFLYVQDFTDSSWPLSPEIQGALSSWKRDCL